MTPYAAPRIKVSVAYAEPLIAIGLETLLRQQADIDVVPTPATGPGDGPAGPHVVVADYLSGVNLAAEGRRRPRARVLPSARVLVITAQDREHEVRSAMDAGVDGYLQLGCDVQDVVAGVRQLARGARCYSTLALQRMADSLARTTLTQREREVLVQVARGHSNKRIGLDLAISVGTVKAHMKAILGKLEASSRTEAASIAAARGLLDDGAPLGN